MQVFYHSHRKRKTAGIKIRDLEAQWNMLFQQEKREWAEKKDQLGKCLPCKHGDLSLIPRITRTRTTIATTTTATTTDLVVCLCNIILALGKQRQEDHKSSLGSQPSLFK